jgi:hypothetical protein
VESSLCPGVPEKFFDVGGGLGPLFFFAMSSSPGLTGRSSIQETSVFNREAAAYWMPRMHPISGLPEIGAINAQVG